MKVCQYPYLLSTLRQRKLPRPRRQINPNGLSGKRRNLLHGPTGNENFNGLAGKEKLSATAPQAKKVSRPRRQRKLSRPRRQRKLSPPRRQRKNFHGPAGKENFHGLAGKVTLTAPQAKKRPTGLTQFHIYRK